MKTEVETRVMQLRAWEHREPLGAAGSHRETLGDAGSLWEPPGAAGSHREPPGASGSHREQEGAGGGRRGQEGKEGPSLKSSEGAWPRDTLILCSWPPGLRETRSLVLSRLIRRRLLQRPREPRTASVLGQGPPGLSASQRQLLAPFLFPEHSGSRARMPSRGPVP